MINFLIFSALCFVDYYFLGLFRLYISIGLNKLNITVKSHFARALREKKEFNTDIIDEDDD